MTERTTGGVCDGTVRTAQQPTYSRFTFIPQPQEWSAALYGPAISQPITIRPYVDGLIDTATDWTDRAKGTLSKWRQARANRIRSQAHARIDNEAMRVAIENPEIAIMADITRSQETAQTEMRGHMNTFVAELEKVAAMHPTHIEVPLSSTRQAQLELGSPIRSTDAFFVPRADDERAAVIQLVAVDTHDLEEHTIGLETTTKTVLWQLPLTLTLPDSTTTTLTIWNSMRGCFYTEDGKELSHAQALTYREGRGEYIKNVPAGARTPLVQEPPAHRVWSQRQLRIASLGARRAPHENAKRLSIREWLFG